MIYLATLKVSENPVDYLKTLFLAKQSLRTEIFTHLAKQL